MRTLADYTANDVTPEDVPAYSTHINLWQTELHPNGALECYFAAEIVRAAWRIERYSVMDSTETSPEFRSAMLHYRDRTNAGIRRNIEELRRLQSDRYLQSHLGILLPGVASLKIVLPSLKCPKNQPGLLPETASATEKVEPAAVANSEAILHAQIQAEERRQMEEFANNEAPEQANLQAKGVTPKPAAPRNAPCPCNSGRKYKHCCGHWSKTGLQEVA